MRVLGPSLSSRRGGAGLAVLATIAAAMALALACDTAPCDDRCGLGTRCEQGKCVVHVEPVAEEGDTDTPAAPTKKRRRRGKRRGGDAGDDSAQAAAPVYDDSAIPRFDPKRVQSIGEGAGSERLADRTVRQHLDRIEPGINRCIEEVVAAGVDVGHGQVSFEIGIEPSGKVWGITATAPKALKDSGVVACMRKKIHAHRFPSWDGPAMGVDYSFDVR